MVRTHRTPRAAVPLFVLLTAACADTEATPSGVATRDSAGITIVENTIDERTPICDVSAEPTLTLGVAEGAPQYQFYRTFGAKRLSDGRIAVVDQGSQQLRLYSPDGRFLHAAGRKGEGPGEFQDAFTLHVLPGDTLWVGDYRPWEWEVFGPDGRWQRSLRPQPPYINPDVEGLLHGGRTVAVTSGILDAPVNRFAPQYATVILHTPDGSIQDTLGVYESGRAGRFDDAPNYIASPMFDSRATVSSGGSRVIVGHTSRAELRIHEIGDSTTLDRVVRWNAEVRPVTDADVAAERTRISERFDGLDAATRQRLVAPQIREDRPVAKTFPTYSTVEVGRDGRIWVRGYRYPDEPENGLQSWLVFAPDGAIACRVTVEPFAQLPDLGSDYILVMRQDELQVERFYLHTLSAPRSAAGE